MTAIQFGVFSVGDVTPDPTTGRTPTEAERIRATVVIAKKAEEVGLDVFATGEHHNPPFVPSSPTTLLGYIAAQSERLILSTSTTLITTNDPVKIAEDFAVLQHLSEGRTDLMLGRGNTGPVYPWFGQDIRDAIPLTVEHYRLLRRLWREEVVDWEGSSERRCRASPSLLVRSTMSRHSCGTVPFGRRRLPNWLPITATGSSPTIFSGRLRIRGGWSRPSVGVSSTTATARRPRRSWGWADRSSCAGTARTRCVSSGRTSTTPRSTVTVRRSRSSLPRHR